MTAVIAEITVSLDGFVTGPDPGPENGLGDGGQALHAWVFDCSDPVVAQVMAEGPLSAGAVVMGAAAVLHSHRRPARLVVRIRLRARRRVHPARLRGDARAVRLRLPPG